MAVADNLSNSTPTWAAISSRRPIRGLALIALSLAFSLAVLIYLGAWASSDRIEARWFDSESESFGHGDGADGAWWEDGLVFVCPLH